jgi:hypothetical protein
MLQRVQLLLDLKTKKELQRLANSQNRSMSEISREILQKGLKKSQQNTSGSQFLLNLSKKAVEGPGDSEYDKYGYDK